jgi:hypothetical protein
VEFSCGLSAFRSQSSFCSTYSTLSNRHLIAGVEMGAEPQSLGFPLELIACKLSNSFSRAQRLTYCWRDDRLFSQARRSGSRGS